MIKQSSCIKTAASKYDDHLYKWANDFAKNQSLSFSLDLCEVKNPNYKTQVRNVAAPWPCKI